MSRNKVFTPEQEAMIAADMRSRAELANAYGVSKSLISLIKDRAGLVKRRVFVENSGLTPKQVHAIRKDWRYLRVIAPEYGVSESIISRIRRGEIYTHV